MQPIRQTIPAFRVAGITVRTSNRDESSAGTAKIGALWGRFFAENVAGQIEQGQQYPVIYGVYSSYASDYTGPFDVTAGIGVPAIPAGSAPVPGFTTVDVEAGTYLVFSAKGAMPQAVVDTWGEIWQFFQNHPEMARRYASDFEAYSGPDEVAIHIGIKA